MQILKSNASRLVRNTSVAKIMRRSLPRHDLVGMIVVSSVPCVGPIQARAKSSQFRIARNDGEGRFLATLCLTVTVHRLTQMWSNYSPVGSGQDRLTLYRALSLWLGVVRLTLERYMSNNVKEVQPVPLRTMIISERQRFVLTPNPCPSTALKAQG